MTETGSWVTNCSVAVAWGYWRSFQVVCTIGIQGSVLPSDDVKCWVLGFSVNTLCGVHWAQICDVPFLTIEYSNKVKIGNKELYFIRPIILATVITVFRFGIYVRTVSKNCWHDLPSEVTFSNWAKIKLWFPKYLD